MALKKILFPILFLFTSLFILLPKSSQSQNHIGLSAIYGKHLIFEDDTIFHDFNYGFDVNYFIDLKDKPWAQTFIANKLVYSFNFLDLSNMHGFYSEQLSTKPRYIAKGMGYHFGATAGLNIPIFTCTNWSINYLPELGLTYVSKTYFTNPSENHLFIGSHINFLFRNEFNVIGHLNEKYSIKSSLRFMHFSNGGWLVPNIGINSLQFTFGVLKRIG